MCIRDSLYIDPMATLKVNDENFDTEVLKSSKPIVVDFWAEWCGPCKMIGPILEEISDEMSNEVTIAKHNIDEEPNTPTKYGVRGIPTMLLFKDGELKSTTIGLEHFKTSVSKFSSFTFNVAMRSIYKFISLIQLVKIANYNYPH